MRDPGGPRRRAVRQMDHQAEPGQDSRAGGGAVDGDALAGAEEAGTGQAGAGQAGTGQAGAGQAGAGQAGAGQAGAGRPSVPETGEPRVDAALQRLAELPGLPVSAHAAVFEGVHAELTDVLGELDPESAATDG